MSPWLIDHTTIFKILHKREFENILMRYYGSLPKASQAFYYGECLKLFSEIPILEAYTMALKQLKQRNHIEISELEQVPYELKSLFYFANPTKLEWKKLREFLNKKYGG